MQPMDGSSPPLLRRLETSPDTSSPRDSLVADFAEMHLAAHPIPTSLSSPPADETYAPPICEEYLDDPEEEELGWFFKAVKEGDVATAEALVEGRIDVCLHGKTPMHIAIEQEDLAMATFLYSQHPDLLIPNRSGKTALDLARNTKIGPLLGIKPDEEPPLLFEAIKAGDLGTIITLLTAGLQPNALSWQGQTPLHKAVEKNNKPIVQALLTAGADRHALNAEGVTALQKARALGYQNIVAILNTKQQTTSTSAFTNPIPDIRTVTTDIDLNSLIRSVLAKDLTEVDTLLNKPEVNPNDLYMLDTTRRTPLHLAAESSTAAIVQALLRAGANPNATDCKNETPLHKAANNKRTSNIPHLLLAGADFAACTLNDKTALDYAARKRDAATVQTLLALGVPPGETSRKYGLDSHNFEETVRLLITAGGPLEKLAHLPVLYPKQPLVCHILSSDTDAFDQIFSEHSCVDLREAFLIACARGREQLACGLVEALREKNSFETSLLVEALTYAVTQGKISIVTNLLEQPEFKTSHFYLAELGRHLQIAIMNDWCDIAKILLAKGARLGDAVAWLKSPYRKKFSETNEEFYALIVNLDALQQQRHNHASRFSQLPLDLIQEVIGPYLVGSKIL